MPNRVLRSSLDVEVRILDKEKRTAQFVASTERAVRTWNGPEVLRMSGVRLGRFRKNPVVLDTHNRYGLDSVIGRADVRVDKDARQLHATIEYAPTAAGEQAWRLVEGGFVRAVSIGYAVNPAKVTRLREGESDGEGDARVEGPAAVVREWELLEISNVPVPADEDAVRRAFFDSLPEEGTMERGINFTDAMGERGEAVPAPKPAPAPVAAPAPKAPVYDETPEERAARVLEANKRAALAICPRGLESVAEAAVLEGLPVEKIRERLLKAQAERLKPVGTPEPIEPEAEAQGGDERAEKPLPAWVTDDVLLRSLENLRS